MNFLKLKRIITAGVIVLNLMSLLSSCTDNGFEVPEVVQKKLFEKYGENFTLTNIGDRINTGTARLFGHPDNDDSIGFTVVYDFKTKEISDDYAVRKIASEFDRNLSAEFAESGFNCSSLTVFMGGTKYSEIRPDENASEYTGRSEVESIYIHLAVKSCDIKDAESSQRFADILTKISSDYNNKKLIVSSFFISDEDYEKCHEELKIKSAVNRNWFEKFNCKFTADIVAVNEKTSLSAADILEGLER